MNKEREITLWLLGLIATDGGIRSQNESLVIQITTVEKEWVDKIVERLGSIGIKTNVGFTKSKHNNRKDCYRISITGSKFYKLIRTYGDPRYCTDRKYSVILKRANEGSDYLPYSDEELDFIRINYKLLSDAELTEALERTCVQGVKKKRLELRLLRNWKDNIE